MKRFVLFLALLTTATAWSQDVAEAARAARERVKASKRATITNEDVPSSSKPASAETEWKDALEQMRSVFRDVCSDSRTQNGRITTDDQLRMMEDAAKPLRARLEANGLKEKEFNERFAKLDQEQEAAVAAATPNGRAANDDDKQRLTAINEDFDARRKALKSEAEDYLKSAAKLKEEVVATSNECPEAAKRLK